MKIKNKLMVWSGYWILPVLTIILIIVVSKVRRLGIWNGDLPLYATGVMFFVMSGICLFFLWKKERVDEETVAHIIFCGILFRLFYIVLTPGIFFQNDLGAFVPDNHEHLGYLYHVYTTGRLPGDGYQVIYQEYQPPLHYIIAALYLKVISLFGVDVLSKAVRLLQPLSVLYSAVVMVGINKIGKKIGIDALGRAICMGVMAFLPYQMYESGALNNDPLVTVFMVLSIYTALLWYEETTSIRTIALAFCIGFAMMSKFSGALVAPAIGIIMLKKFWDNRAEWKRYMAQFALFGVLVFPLGLWYNIWRYIQCGMPLGYVPALETYELQYMGEIPFWRRLFDFRGAFDYPALRYHYAEGVGDYNIFVSLVKFSVFKTNDFHWVNGATYVLGHFLFWTTLVLFVGLIICTTVWIFQKKNSGIQRLLLGGTAILYVLFYLRFCVQYPFLCTMEIRYILLALYLGLLCLGAILSSVRDRIAGENVRKKVMAEKIIFSVFVIYLVCAALLTINLELVIV